MRDDLRPDAGLLLGLCSAVAFGSSGPAGKALMDAGLTPLQAAWLRLLGATLIMLPFALRRGGAALRAAWSARSAVAAYGVLGVGACVGCYFYAASRLPVGVASLLEFTGPLMLVGWLKLVVRRHIPRAATGGVLIALAGLAMVVQVWSGLALDAIGVLFGLAAAAGQVVYFVVGERETGRLDPIVLTGWGTAIASLVLLIPAHPWTMRWHVLAGHAVLGSAQVPVWTVVVWIVVVSTVVAYLCGIGAVRALSAPVAAGVAYLESVAAATLAWLVLGQSLSAIQIAGGVIVLSGALVSQLASSRTPMAAEQLGERQRSRLGDQAQVPAAGKAGGRSR